MVINSFENKTFMGANVKAQHAVWGASFRFFWEWGRVGFFIFSFFLMCSQAPNFFLKTCSISFFIPYCSAIAQPTSIYRERDCKGVRGVWDDGGQREAWQSMFWFWGKYIQVSMLWSSPCFKHIGNGPIKCPPSGAKKLWVHLCTNE